MTKLWRSGLPDMEHTLATSLNQVISGKRRSKKIVRLSPWLYLASLPKIDPCLVSIAALASRLIDQVEGAFTSIINAPNNDGREVTLTQWFRGACDCPELFEGERVETDAAFNILIGDTFDMLINRISDWHLKLTRIHLDTLDIIDGKFKVEPPIEIQQATQAFALTRKRRAALTDMLYHSMRNPAYSAAN
jgi:hypothetical protein